MATSSNTSIFSQFLGSGSDISTVSTTGSGHTRSDSETDSASTITPTTTLTNANDSNASTSPGTITPPSTTPPNALPSTPTPATQAPVPVSTPDPAGSITSTTISAPGLPSTTPSSTSSISAFTSSSSTVSSTIAPAAASSSTAKSTTPAAPTSKLDIPPGYIKSNIYPATAAGLGIGCAAIGALLGLLIMFLIMRKRSRKSRYAAVHSEKASPVSPRGNEKGFAMASIQPVASTASGASAAFAFLPQPVATSSLVNELSTIRTSIRNHVGNFYHSYQLYPEAMEGVSHALQAPELMLAVGNSSAQSMARNLNSIETRSEAMMLLLATAILSKIDPDQSYTILPNGAVECHHLLNSRQNGQPDGGDSRLISRWRQMTLFLLRPHYEAHSFTATDDRITTIAATFNAIDAVLAGFAKQDRDEDRRANLKLLLERAAEFGYTLLSQPSSWRLDWSGSGSAAAAVSGKRERGSVVLFPQLMQMTGDEGAALATPTLFGEKAWASRLRVA